MINIFRTLYLFYLKKQRCSWCSGKGHRLRSSCPGFNPWVLHNLWKNKRNPLFMPPHSRTHPPLVTVGPNQGFVAVVAGLSNGAAQLLGGCGSGHRPAQVTMRPKSGVVVAVVTGSRLRCCPRVRPGFGDFLGLLSIKIVGWPFPHRPCFFFT
jgi:hypothetical protein